MKKFRDFKNEIYYFEDECFDEKGNCINEFSLKVIEENNLVEITGEEEEAIRSYKTPEQLVEEERLAKLPTQEDILSAKIELKALELLSQLELI